MGHPKVGRRTFVLKLNLNCGAFCEGCVKKVKGVSKNIDGVDSFKIDTEQGIATVSGTASPETVIRELEKKKYSAELLFEESPPPPINNQEMMQLVLHQTPVPRTRDQLIVPQPQQPGKALKAVDVLIVKKTNTLCPNHDKELKLKSCNKRFTCDGCREDGFGSRFRCDHCDYELHKECMSPEHSISHELFPGYIFQFSQSPRSPSLRYCDACGKGIYGYSYRCKNLDFHPRCSKLPVKQPIGLEGTVIVLRNKGLAKDCLFCEKKRPNGVTKGGIQGWSYVSECKNYHFHVCCVVEMMHETLKRAVEEGANCDTDSMALENIDLQLMATNKSSRNGGRGSKFWKTVSMFLRTIVGVLLGDPTVVLASMLVEFLKS